MQRTLHTNSICCFFLTEVAERKRRRRNPLPPIAGEQRGAPPTSTKLGNGSEEVTKVAGDWLVRSGRERQLGQLRGVDLSLQNRERRQSYYVDSAA
jgi:hypothetical protein